MACHMYRWFSDTTLCAYIYCNPVYTSLIGTQLRLTTKLTYLMAGYYTPNDRFTTNDASFYKKKSCLATLKVADRFLLIVYTIIKITLRCTNVPLYKLLTSSQKRTLEEKNFFLFKYN